MVIVGNNQNTAKSLTVSNRTVCNPYWTVEPFTAPYKSPWAYPTTDGESPLSNALTEYYVNALLPYRIDRVIFHDPATIVIWMDKTKTVVKCHNEEFDKEKGLAMCIAKKVLDNKFHKTFRE